MTCDGDLLRRSLDDLLSEQQEEALAAHLSGCSACQAKLEQLAGERQEWLRVGDILRREAGQRNSNVAAISCDPGQALEVAPQPSAGDAMPEGAVLEADFAVDFLDPSSNLEALGRLDEIDILGVIGRGGMGIVLKGFEPQLNRPVAVKVLAPHLATSGAARRRFAREAQATAVVVHANVMPILTVSSSGKLPYIVMPYVPCESLQQRLDREGPLPALDVLRIGLQIARGLAAAHAQGLVHRDVKPANVLLEKGIDRAMLTDFGLARAVDDASLTRTGIIAGTPQYMSPEQARGEPVDARSDLFSLGSVLYTMCTGRPPFRAETSYGILRRITDDQPRAMRELNNEVPGWLAAVVEKLMSKQPDSRFASTEELADHLEGQLAGVQSVGKPASRPSPQTTVDQPIGYASIKRHYRFIGAVAAAVVACASALWMLSPLFTGALRNESAPQSQSINPPSQSTPSSATAQQAPDATDWDGIEQTIMQLEKDSQRLQQDADRFWDPSPAPSSPEQLRSSSPLSQEPMS